MSVEHLGVGRDLVAVFPEASMTLWLDVGRRRRVELGVLSVRRAVHARVVLGWMVAKLRWDKRRLQEQVVDGG
jgi:hypothetical protein